MVRADFDGDGTADYALLLKSDKSVRAKLVVVLCPADGGCKSVYSLDLGTDGILTYLRPVRVGSRVAQTDAIDTKEYPARVTLKSAGIEVNYFEKATVVLYWNRKDKKIEEIQTSD